jgi:hypothetical protein
VHPTNNNAVLLARIGDPSSRSNSPQVTLNDDLSGPASLPRPKGRPKKDATPKSHKKKGDAHYIPFVRILIATVIASVNMLPPASTSTPEPNANKKRVRKAT